ncbi:mitochondral 37S ribosomal protein S27 [Pichia californica]|nr:mitochondral 37S ribosomal protein S27 [[Candida] californica]
MSAAAKGAIKIIAPSKQKLFQLEQLQCQVFKTTFNPTNMKTGAKILSAPLKGQTLSKYYGPSDFPSIAKVARFLSTPSFQVINEGEAYRMERVEDLKRRGKGSPKKIREKAASAAKGKKKK